MDLFKSIFKGDKVVWTIFLLLCLLSVIEGFSASSTLSFGSGDYWAPITRHGTFLLVGALFVWLFHNIPYRWFSAIPVILLPVSIVLLAYLTISGFLWGDRINGASRWLDKDLTGGISFQPSELAKMAVVIVVAFILSKGQNERGAHPLAFTRIMIIAAVVCGLILPENYSTAFMLFATVFLQMIIGRVQARKLLLLGAVLATAGVLFVLFLKNTDKETLQKIPFGHRLTVVKQRISDFSLSGEKVPASAFDMKNNAQVGHARIAVATSTLLGKGPGNSVERDHLPHAYSDFIYAIIIEELGLVGGFVVVLLYVCLLIRVGKIAKKCDRTFPAFLIIGIALLLVIQAMFNMLVAVGLFPVTGQPLPLVSRGGTSVIINCIYVGMILSVSRYTAGLDAKIAAQRAHDAQLQMEVSTGVDEPMAFTWGKDADVQSISEPTSAAYNGDSEMV